MPKEFAMSDIYCQLIPNEDASQPFYEIVPRIGSFEISVNGVLLFSKMLSKIWPNPQAVARKCQRVCETANQGGNIQEFQTTGKCTIAPRSSKQKQPETSQLYAHELANQAPAEEI